MGVRQLVAFGRRLIASTFLDRAVVADRVVVTDGVGGWTEAWADRPVALACRYVRRVHSDVDPGGVGSGEFDYPDGVALLVPVGTDLEAGSRITDPATGKRWIITSRPSIDTELATADKWALRELDEGA